MELPEGFTTYTRKMLGDALYERFAEGMAMPSPVSIRLNPLKCDGREVNPSFAPREVPWCRGGYYLNDRPGFTFDPLLHAGAYYVQDASSMFVDEILRQQVDRPVRMLDLCAAPGGKSTAALSALPRGSLLFSNEPIPLRAQILSENIQKYGHPDVVVTNNYPQDYQRSGLTFDVILTDVPCSGEGMFRKDEGAVAEWSVQHVDQCHRLQRDIVLAAWECLRPGGMLIYSTCTLNTKENEDQVVWMVETLGALPTAIDIDARWGIIGSLYDTCPYPVYRFIPGIARGEGQFMAVLRKEGEIQPQSTKTRKSKSAKGKSQKCPDDATATISSWLTDGSRYDLRQTDNAITAIPKAWDVFSGDLSALRILHRGVRMALIKGRDVIPQHGLALSAALHRESFTTVDVGQEAAIAYLRKESILLPPSTPCGYILLTFHDQPLGFVKNIGNRSNNLYPQEWKIKSTHIPENPNEILIKQ